ncbi:MAG: RdgB/HAM1 family non-canonical purine NTP pyrophosphatase [Muribaculaceae bacterium]|nr:RdgB/HAM1 family non-canonical purine NTP pyrophosphatase [Muribaculaceae bacterium]
MENKIKIVFATGNQHKLQEINEISKGSGIEFILPPENFDPQEDGTTFEQNSYIKAKEAAKLSKMISLADDSGLCVEALNGEPGIYSARYAQTPQARIDKLLANLTDSGNRSAKFVCAMTLVNEAGEILTSQTGECHGKIALKQSGTNGFGYDPVFEVDGYDGLTMADISEEEKNKISHRSKALNKIIRFIQTNLN